MAENPQHYTLRFWCCTICGLMNFLKFEQCPRCKENTPVNEVDVQSPHVVERLAGGETAAVVPDRPLLPGSAEWRARMAERGK